MTAVQTEKTGFDGALSCLPTILRQQIMPLPTTVKAQIEELRFRVGQPIMAYMAEDCRYVQGGRLYPFQPDSRLIRLTPTDIEAIFSALCRYSVHSYGRQLRGGFVTLPGGHRAGICGTAVVEDGGIAAVRQVTSINLRIARSVDGAADDLIGALSPLTGGILIAGAPGSGKTTILRDIARRLPTLPDSRWTKLAVIDERGELGGAADGQPGLDLGPCCDLLDGYPKGEGILTALRVLSPQVILCDEVGGMEDVEAIRLGANSGVIFIATVHAADREDCLRRPQIRSLTETGAFRKIALLYPGGARGRLKEWIEL